MRSTSFRRAVTNVIETLELRRMFSNYVVEATYNDSQGQPFGTFGRGMATNGSLALIASPGTPGTNDSVATVGHVSLINTTTGAVVRVFNNPDPEEGDFFGNAVTWVGNKIAISAPESTAGGEGKVYVYDDAADLTPLEIDSPYPTISFTPVFGATLAAYGNDLLVGVAQTNDGGNANGAIIKYDLDGSDAPLVMTDPNSTNNDQLAAGSLVSDGVNIWATAIEDSGAVVVKFNGNGNYLTSINQYDLSGSGNSLAVDATRLIIGAPGANSVYQLNKNDASLQQTYTGGPLDFGFGAAVAINGGSLAIGSPAALTAISETEGYVSGRASIYTMSTGALEDTIENPAPQQVTPDEGQLDGFGTVIAALPSGRFLIADPYDDNGGFDVGRVWKFGPEVVAPPNTPPSNAAIAGPASGVRNQTLTFNGSFVDPGDTDTVTWNFGDSTGIPARSTTAPGALQPSHAYTASGSYTITMTITDSANQSTSATKIVNITATGVQGGTLYVGGTSGTDAITFTKNGNNTVANVNGTNTTYSGNNIVVYGGAGTDVILAGNNVTANMEVHGGDGTDLITGGNGNNILIGDAGADLLIGGTARDILIGGSGSDILIGGGADDILIAGSTTNDNDSARLNQIMTIWKSTATYQARVNSLSASLLNPDTVVFDDGSIDVLTGEAGRDWFFANNDAGVRDLIVDRAGNEVLSDIDAA